jgi:hypothetical protein
MYSVNTKVRQIITTMRDNEMKANKKHSLRKISVNTIAIATTFATVTPFIIIV